LCKATNKWARLNKLQGKQKESIVKKVESKRNRKRRAAETKEPQEVKATLA